MKLSPRDALNFFRNPDPKRPALLIYGADPMRVAGRRQEVLQALLGENATEEMRLTRMTGAELRKDPASIVDAIKAQGFFPGARAVLVEEAADGASAAIAAGLEDWAEGDANIVITAGQLTPRSSLRKLFEKHRTALVAAIYDDPPSRDEVNETLRKAGLDQIGTDGLEAIFALSRVLDPGDFRQTVEKVALYKLGDATPLSAEDVAQMAPRTAEADLDDALNIVAGGETGMIGPVLAQLYAQGVLPVGLCIGATRHFRNLHVAASDPGGASSGMAKLRPPVFGPRREKMQRQASNWGRERLEQALSLLLDTDLQLRSADTAPQKALMERALIRLSMMARR